MPPINVPDIAKLKAKAKAVVDAVRAQHGTEQFSVRTSRGEVQIERVQQVTDEHGVDFIEVFLAGQTVSDEAHYRIINPPLDVVGPDGVRREDPVQALAEALARFGGRRK